MINKITRNKPFNHKEWIINEVNNPKFTASNGEVIILFECEYKNGLYYKINSVTTIKNNRSYTALRYFHKYYRYIMGISFELLKNNYLWDYQKQQTALKSYKKDIEPYYKKCKELGLTFYADEAFLEELFK